MLDYYIHTYMHSLLEWVHCLIITYITETNKCQNENNNNKTEHIHIHDAKYIHIITAY